MSALSLSTLPAGLKSTRATKKLSNWRTRRKQIPDQAAARIKVAKIEAQGGRWRANCEGKGIGGNLYE